MEVVAVYWIAEGAYCNYRPRRSAIAAQVLEIRLVDCSNLMWSLAEACPHDDSGGMTTERMETVNYLCVLDYLVYPVKIAGSERTDHSESDVVAPGWPC